MTPFQLPRGDSSQNQLRQRRGLNLPLRVVLTVPFVLLTVGTTGLVGYLSWQNGQRSVSALANELIQEVEKRTESHIRSYLETAHLANINHANAIELGQLSVYPPGGIASHRGTHRLEQYLCRQLQTYPSLTATSWSDAQGNFVGIVRSLTGQLAVHQRDIATDLTVRATALDQQCRRGKRLTRPGNFDPRERPWYRLALQKKQAFWSPIFTWKAAPVISTNAVLPIYDSTGKFRYMLGTSLGLSDINRYLKTLKVGQSGQVFIIEQSSLVVASSTSQEPFSRDADATPKRRSAFESDEPLLRASANYIQQTYGGFGNITQPQQVTAQFDRSKYVLEVIPLSDSRGIHWLMMVIVPESDFMKQIDANTRTTVLLSAGALLGSVIFGLLLTRSIVRPIQRLGHVSLALADGDWSDGSQGDSPIAELQVLNRSFDRMAGQLQQSFDRIKTALHESEEKFTTVFRTSPDPIAIISPKWQYLEINDAFVRLAEYSRDEVIGRTALDLGLWLYGDERERYRQLLQVHGHVQNLELNFRSRSGNRLTLLVSAETIDLQGQRCIVVTGKEISDRKRAEEALRQYERIVELTTDSISLVDRNYIYRVINPSYTLRFSKPCSEIVGHSVAELAGQPIFETLIKPYLDRCFAGEMVRYEHWFEYPVLGWQFMRVTYDPYVEVDQSISGAVVTVHNLTELKRTEDALQDSEARFRSAFENAPIGMAMIGLDDCWIKVNPMLCDMLGYSEAELLNRDTASLVHAEDLEKLRQSVEQALLDQTNSVQTKLRYHCKSGNLAWARLSLSVVRDGQNQPLYYVVQIQDITEQQVIDRIKNEFISVVSHELRTPLTAIQGCLGLLETGIYDARPEKAKRMLTLALTNSDRLVRLVNDILDLERLDSGKVELLKDVGDAGDLMRRAVEGVSAIADQTSVTISIAPTAINVWASPDAVIQTLTNLLSNAIKFSPPHGAVAVSAQSQQQMVLFQVKDHGRGIPADKIETIFGRFQQVDVSDSRQKGGTGLGLAICQSIVHQHGGNIWAESILGEGTTFCFTLPKPPENNHDEANFSH